METRTGRLVLINTRKLLDHQPPPSPPRRKLVVQGSSSSKSVEPSEKKSGIVPERKSEDTRAQRADSCVGTGSCSYPSIGPRPDQRTNTIRGGHYPSNAPIVDSPCIPCSEFKLECRDACCATNLITTKMPADGNRASVDGLSNSQPWSDHAHEHDRNPEAFFYESLHNMAANRKA